MSGPRPQNRAFPVRRAATNHAAQMVPDSESDAIPASIASTPATGPATARMREGNWLAAKTRSEHSTARMTARLLPVKRIRIARVMKKRPLASQAEPVGVPAP